MSRSNLHWVHTSMYCNTYIHTYITMTQLPFVTPLLPADIYWLIFRNTHTSLPLRGAGRWRRGAVAERRCGAGERRGEEEGGEGAMRQWSVGGGRKGGFHSRPGQAGTLVHSPKTARGNQKALAPGAQDVRVRQARSGGSFPASPQSRRRLAPLLPPPPPPRSAPWPGCM